MFSEDTLAEIVELLETAIQYRDFQYVREALLVVQNKELYEEEAEHNIVKVDEDHDEMVSIRRKRKELKKLRR